MAGAVAAGPASLATLVTAGASGGYVYLWVVVLAAVAGGFAQYLSTRLGLRTDGGIVSLVDRRLGTTWKWVLVGDGVLAAGLAQLVIMKTLADVSAAVTGIDAHVWGVAWAVTLAVGLAGGGYRLAEWGAKLLVSLVVLAFVASLIVVPVDVGNAAAGLVPTVPGGASGALLVAGVLGGAVHVTLVTMQTYTVDAHGWTWRDERIALLDVSTSMLAAFGIFSLAVYLVAASVLHTPDVNAASLTATTAAQALGPLAGPYAKWLFLLGLWGAAVSTLGGNTVAPPFLVADALDWGTDTADGRYRALLAATALVSALGAFVGGAFFPLLVLVLAFGLIGTPFAIAVVLYLLNDGGLVDATPHPAANAGGVALIAVTSVAAWSSISGNLAGRWTTPLGLFVLAFA
ncbi:divalent metal cation transporter, partial [Halarchaeum acidiphilum]